MHAGGYPPPKPTSAHAVLPWLLVVRGSPEQRGLAAICAHFGKCSIDIVSLSADAQLRPRLKGALATRSPLDAFVDAVCGMHAAAIRAGLPPRSKEWGQEGSAWGDGAWGRKDWGVALSAPVDAPDAAATVVAACLHWLGCLPLEESVAVARKRCASDVNEVCASSVSTCSTVCMRNNRDTCISASVYWCMGVYCCMDGTVQWAVQGLIRAATCKLAREFTFQPHPLRVTWPYGGSDDVVLMINAGSNHNGTGNDGNGSSSSGAKGGSKNTPTPPRSPRQGGSNGGAKGGKVKQNRTAVLADVMYAGASGCTRGGGGLGGVSVLPRTGGNGLGAQAPKAREVEPACIQVAEGCQEIIMQRSKSGLYSADLLVCSHPFSLPYNSRWCRLLHCLCVRIPHRRLLGKFFKVV